MGCSASVATDAAVPNGSLDGAKSSNAVGDISKAQTREEAISWADEELDLGAERWPTLPPMGQVPAVNMPYPF